MAFYYLNFGETNMKNTHLKLSILAGSMLLASAVNALEIKQQDHAIIFDDLDNLQYVAKVRLPNGSLQTFKVNNGEFAASFIKKDNGIKLICFPLIGRAYFFTINIFKAGIGKFIESWHFFRYKRHLLS